MSEPIFVLGIYPRSGTNHLLDLLCVHPDCAPPQPIWEDRLLAHAAVLERYVQAVGRSWDPRWGVTPAHSQALLEALGGGLQQFLAGLAGSRRVVTKTPRVDQLELFPALFPRASLLILVRDGRAVVESGVRSFGWSRDHATHEWARAARRIAAFDTAQRGGPLRYRIVRYEDLVAQPEASLRELLAFLELDAERYDFDKALSAPVLGSSTLLRKRGDRVHWQAVERSEDFDPLERFAHWSRGRHARFNWIAGDALRALGYLPQPAPEGIASALGNRLRDLAYLASRGLRGLLRVARRSIASA